jgi:DNA-binding NarL/FixJ family response regulator
MAITAPPGRTPHDRHPAFAERSLESLLAQKLESLADVAAAHGRRAQATRLRAAAALLEHEFEQPGRDELTPRERDVARLVAEGRSNRYIAQALVISERTVDTHVSHMLRKLGLDSRVQIAAWVLERGRHLTLLS